jgi:oligopeptide transport system substrate-binding protein
MQPETLPARFFLQEGVWQKCGDDFSWKAGEYVRNRLFSQGKQTHLLSLVCLCFCLMILAACGGRATSSTVNGTTRLAARQVLVVPNVGIQDLDNLDPAQEADENSALAITMIYSGLVRLDQNLNVIPDQASWTISADRKVYTFHLKPGITFSDGTPVTAQTYVYSLTRALLPAVQSNDAMLFLGNIVGASQVSAGKSRTLSGVRAVDATTLVITLSKPTEYFLPALANPLAFPVNQKVIEEYGESDWPNHVVDNGVGTGPFVVKAWQHNTKMVLVPNPRYYGSHTRLQEVDMIFAVDAHTAFQAYQGGQYSFVWNILPSDLTAARGLAGFSSQSLLQTDALFFNTQMPPFDQPAVRQAFAYAIDKTMIAQSVLNNSVVPAPTIVPAGIPGYQPNLTTIPFSRAKALATLQTVYPDVSQVPPVTFSYPSSLVSSALATALQQMWQTALGIPIKLLPVETNAYNIEVANHQVQLGFAQWNADFPDPYDILALNLSSSAAGNAGKWQNAQFDQLIQQAEQSSGTARLDLYGQAEQIAITDAGWLPLDHQTLSAIIPSTVHGVSLNHAGLYFGDWSDVYLLQR